MTDPRLPDAGYHRGSRGRQGRAVVQFSVLGMVEVRLDGRSCDLGPPKQRALLVRLLLDVTRPVSVDRLIEDLWGGAPPARATASLQAYVSNLRRILEPDRPPRAPARVLVTQPPGYALRVPTDAVDAVRFRDLGSAASAALDAGEPAAALDMAVEALGLWRGPALADVADEPFAGPEINRLEDLRLSVEEVRLGAALALGRAGEVAAELDALVTREPLRERLWELLLVALYRSGRSADALERYQRVRQLLDDELGLEPGPALRELEQAVLRQDPALAPGRASTAPGDRLPTMPAPTPNRLQPALDDAGRPPLAGRDAEVDLLGEVLHTAASGTTRWVVLTGEAGMGKTRLAEAARDLAVSSGWQVAVARCHDDADTPAHWLWSQVLREVGQHAPSGVDADPIAELTSGARQAAGPQGARFALYEGIEQALRAAATRPLLLILDDLHWADGDSLRALRFLAVQLRDVPLAVLATVRDGEGEPALREVLAAVARQPGVQRIAVPPVDLAAVRSIAEALRGEAVDEAAGARLLERSGGNPFFATELVRLSAATDETTLPAGVRDVVRRRLGRLPADVQAVLTLAGVAGKSFDAGVVAAASEQDVVELFDLLDPALATGVVREDDEPLRYRFTHDLLREALLSELTPVQRRRLHGRIARALAARGDRGMHGVAELAHHLAEAGPLGNPAEAVRAAGEAAQQAHERFAYDEAARWYGRALEVHAVARTLQIADPADRSRLLVARGDALYRAARAPEARGVLIEAIAEAATAGDVDTVAEAAAVLSSTGGLWTWVDLGQLPEDALARLQAALDALGPAPTPARARLLSMLSVGRYFGAAPDHLERLSADALATATALGDPLVLADVLLDRSFLRWTRDSCDESVALADEVLSLDVVSDLQRVVAHGRRFVALLFLGEVTAAVDAHGRAEALARQARLVGPLMQLAHLPIALAIAQGRFDDAEALLAESWALHERGDVPVIAEANLSMELLLHRHRRGLADQLPLLQQLKDVLDLRASHLLLALAALDDGDPEAGIAAISASQSAPRIPWMELLADTIEAEVRARLPVTPAAEALADTLGPYEDMIAAAGTTYWWGPVGLATAALEHRLGRLEQAEARLRRCLERTEAHRLVVWTTQAQWHLAAVLADRGADEEARALRATAQRAAGRSGMALPALPGDCDADAKSPAKSPLG